MTPHRIVEHFCLRCGVHEEFFRTRPEVARRCLPGRRRPMPSQWSISGSTVTFTFDARVSRVVMNYPPLRRPRPRRRKAWKGWR